MVNSKTVGWKYFKLNGKKYRIDGLLALQIDKAYKDMLKDDDIVMLIFGPERFGKSKLRDLIGGYWEHISDQKFTVDNIHFLGQDYMKVALKDNPYTFHSHDETRRDLNSKRSMSKTAVDFTNYLSECGDNNQAHCLILPAFCDIDKYVALWRAKLIIEIGKWKDHKTGEYNRGLFRVIKTRNRKKLLYYHKNKYTKFPKSMVAFTGFFEDNDVIPNEDYKKKKQKYKEEKYTQQEKESTSHVLTPRQREVITLISPSKAFERGHKDYEVLKKLQFSLRKLSSGETS